MQPPPIGIAGFSLHSVHQNALARTLRAMSTSRPTLLVPVENQVRELDAKLLFSLIAAERGYPVILGARATLHREAASLPRGVYVAKSVRALSTRMFGIYRDLGSDVISWDEESLVRNPNPAFWYRRRVAKEALDLVRAFFAWGEADAEAFRNFPEGCSPPVHATGNPRLDLMRPELRRYFDTEVATYRERHGEFLLVNTNFGLVNHYVDAKSGVVPLPPGDHSEEAQKIGEGLVAYRRAMFEAFQSMVPAVATEFPEKTIVVRPHPVEKHDVWEAIAKRHNNVVIAQEGNVLPWLLAAQALIQSGCTTGVEAYGLGVPVVAYEPVPNKNFDSELPNALSRRASDLPELSAHLRDALGTRGSAADVGQAELARRHMASLDGPLASERILDVLDGLYANGGRPAAPGPRSAHCCLDPCPRARGLQERARGHAGQRQQRRLPEAPLPRSERRKPAGEHGALRETARPLRRHRHPRSFRRRLRNPEPLGGYATSAGSCPMYCSS